MEDPRRPSRCPQGNSRPYLKPRVAGCEFEELRPLELHARKTGRHGEMGQIRSRDAGQEAAAEAGRVAKSPSEPLGALSQNFRLRIWGSEVRILPGAPIPSSTYGRAPFESRQLKRFFKRFL